MRVKVGEVEAMFRYPVKSMAGECLDAVDVGWHGLDGDRRLGLRRVDDRGGFPWLTASKMPELVRFSPQRRDTADVLPTHVRTPDGEELPLFGPELAAQIGRRHGSPLELTHLNRGIFDEASVSIITSTTVNEIARLGAHGPDSRRYRPNIVITPSTVVPFTEDEWVGGVLVFGDEEVALGITNHDERCAMVNIDPDSGRLDPGVLKTIVRARINKAGIYATVLRRGQMRLGQPVFFVPSV